MLKCLTLGLTGLVLAGGPLDCSGSQQLVRPEPDCVILRVVDGDTFHCRNGLKVRLIGTDSPESRQRPYGGRARLALHELMPPGTAVRLEIDVAPSDRYGRVLAYAWVDSTLINETMVRDGWAVRYTVPPNVKYAERLGRAQNEARARGTGLWAERGFDCLPADFRRGKCLSRP